MVSGNKDNSFSWIEKRLTKIEHQQERIIGLLNKVISKEESLSKKEDEAIALESKELKEVTLEDHKESEEIKELEDIEKLEKRIEKEVEVSPLKRITLKDLSKGAIGSFFGLVGHFAFAEGKHIGENFSTARSVFLLVLSFFIIVLFLYFSGFRKVEDRFFFKLFPLRAFVLYSVSIVTIIVVLLIYDKISFSSSFHEVLNTVAATSILAVIGAATADLIGRNEGE